MPKYNEPQYKTKVNAKGVIYFSPEMKQGFSDSGPMDSSTPYKWIPLSGDVEQGWMVFRTEDGVEVCFHAPSVAMELFSY